MERAFGRPRAKASEARPARAPPRRRRRGARREEHAPVDARAIDPNLLVGLEHRKEEPLDLVRPAPREDGDRVRPGGEPQSLASLLARRQRELARRVADVMSIDPEPAPQRL